MSEEKLYAVKNDEGKWSDAGDYFGNYAWATPDKDECERDAKQKGGHVVSLVEEAEKAVVSEEEANFIKQLENYPRNFLPAGSISDFVDEHQNHYGSHNRALDELRLINALVNGYTVRKEKRYLLPLEGSEDSAGEYAYYADFHRGRWEIEEYINDGDYPKPTVSETVLANAPEWVKAIKPVEVTEDAD